METPKTWVSGQPSPSCRAKRSSCYFGLASTEVAVARTASRVVVAVVCMSGDGQQRRLADVR